MKRLTIDGNFARPARFGVDHRTNAAFTLAELVIGLAVLTLVGGAAAAVAASVARGWEVGGSTATSTVTISRTIMRLQDKLQRAKFVGEWRPGSHQSAVAAAPSGAAVLFWLDDLNGDGLMQLDETQLIEHDRVTKELFVYEPSFPDPVTRAAHNGPFPPAMLSGGNAILNYKGLLHMRTYPLAKGVLGAAFNVITPAKDTQRRTFEFQLRFNGVDGETVEYGTATARSPS